MTNRTCGTDGSAAGALCGAETVGVAAGISARTTSARGFGAGDVTALRCATALCFGGDNVEAALGADLESAGRVGGFFLGASATTCGAVEIEGGDFGCGAASDGVVRTVAALSAGFAGPENIFTPTTVVATATTVVIAPTTTSVVRRLR